MKVTNWRRKLIASLVAGGLLSPTVVSAANLDTNLIANPGFEDVDLAITGDYGAPSVRQWLGGPGFAYSHQPDVTGIPDYADGDDPPNAGNWYFTANNNPGSATGDWRAPDGVFQDIDVSTGPTGTQIGTGEAAYKLSGWMSSYANDNDVGVVHLDFRNGTGTSLGTAEIRDSDPGSNNVWSLNSAAGLVPVGTATVRVSLFGGVANGGTDGYIDNVDLQLTAAANEMMYLEVNTTSGQVSIRNQTGEPVNIDYYEITSASGALSTTAWNSLQEQNLAGFPAGNGSGNGWEQFGGASSTAIGESYLRGNSAVPTNASIGLGAAFNPVGAHDLVFQYSVVEGPTANPTGDFNGSGAVENADLTLLLDNWGAPVPPVPAGWTGDQPTPAAVDNDELTRLLDNWGAGGGPTGPGALRGGFVRYVTSGIGTGDAVPEPAGIWLVGIGLASFVVASRRKP